MITDKGGSIKIVDGAYYKKCEICLTYFRTKKSHLDRRKTCSKECDANRKRRMYVGNSNPNYGNRGERNPLYKGGYINKHGYKLFKKPEHPNAGKDGYILEHRYVMSEHLGRPLEDWEVVHHKDGNKLNNEISNLEVLTKEEHSYLHSKDYDIVRDYLGRIIGLKRRTSN